MEKKIIEKFGKKFYLVGVVNGEKYYLKEATFDCDWYWGLGYMVSFNKNYSDYECFTHFDSLFKDYNDLLNVEECVLDKNEKWVLLELMHSLYTYRDFSDMIYQGSSHITTNPCEELIKDNEEYEKINKVLIPELLKKVYELLGEGEE